MTIVCGGKKKTLGRIDIGLYGKDNVRTYDSIGWFSAAYFLRCLFSMTGSGLLLVFMNMMICLKPLIHPQMFRLFYVF